MKNPFQFADVRQLPWWNAPLYDEKNELFEQLTRDLEVAFNDSVNSGRIASFFSAYDEAARTMLGQMPHERLLRSVLEYAFPRLIAMYCYRRQRLKSRQAFIGGNSSVVRWNIDPRLLESAVDQADRMERSRVTHQTFDIKTAPGLRRWLHGEYWPLVSKFSGIAAFPIVGAHVRCMSSQNDGDGYRARFQYHPFGNHHYDQDVYSLPLIIYLSEVTESCGPFQYLAACDKFSTSFVLRAFHQALNHDCDLSPLEEKNFAAISRLPSVFRGGDVMGNLYTQRNFAEAEPVSVFGGIGAAVLFDGFNVIHAGGFPINGCRKSLFVNFRFPVAKLISRAQMMRAPRLEAFKTGAAA